MKKFRVVEKGGRFLVKRGQKIVGFAFKVGEVAKYAFGAPGQPGGYIAFEVPCVEVGIARIEEFYGGY